MCGRLAMSEAIGSAWLARLEEESRGRNLFSSLPAEGARGRVSGNAVERCRYRVDKPWHLFSA